MSNKKLTGTLIPKDNKKAKMHATFYSDKPIGSGGDSEIFDEYIDATDQQRNTALANVSNQTANSTTGKMGYKVLDPTKTFAEQVTAENTIYEVRDVFEIGENYTIPNGVTLKFDGGKITGNGTLTLQNTKIEGVGTISCNCSGSINGVLDYKYFGLKSNDQYFDNGVIINKYSTLSRYLKIEDANTYYYSTPIVLNNRYSVNFDTCLVYNGINGNKSTIVVDNSTSNNILEKCNYYFRKVICDYSNVKPDYSHDKDYFLEEDENTVILRGIEFSSVNNSDINVGHINHFNENIRVSDVNAKGNAYNTYTVGYSLNANVHIRVYQDNGGWCYGNRLTMQRCTNSYSSFSDSQSNHYYSCAAIFAGPGRNTDIYNDCSDWYILQSVFEGFDQYAFLLKNCGGFNFVGGSVETSNKNPYLVKVIGYCTFLNVSGVIISNIVDTSEATSFSYWTNFTNNPALLIHMDGSLLKAHCHRTRNDSTYTFTIDNDLNIGSAYYQYKDVIKSIGLQSDSNGEVSLDDFGNVSFLQNFYLGVVVNTTYCKQFLLRLYRSAIIPHIIYLKDSNNQDITFTSSAATTKAAQEAFGLPTNNIRANPYAWDNNIMAFGASEPSATNRTIIITIPDGVNQILLRLKTSTFDIYSYGYANIIIPTLPNIGDTSGRPNYSSIDVNYNTMTRTKKGIAWIGFEYLDTTLGKKIMMTSDGWKNLDGTALS